MQPTNTQPNAPTSNTPFNNGAPLTTQQIQNMRQQMNISPTAGNSSAGSSNVSSQWAKYDGAQSTQNSQPSNQEPIGPDGTPLAPVENINKVSGDINSAGAGVNAAITGTGNYAGQNSLQRGLGAASEAATGVMNTAADVVPFGDRALNARNTVGGGLIKDAGDVLGTLGTMLGSTKAAQYVINKFPGLSDALINAGTAIATAGTQAGNISGTILGAEGVAGAGYKALSAVTDAAPKVVSATSDAASTAKNTASNAASTVKEAIKPSLTPEEATGQVIQGKTEDIAAAKRTLSSTDTTGVKTYKDLQTKLNSEIKPLAQQVDTELSKDPTARPISTFEKTVGEGTNATKINYVQEAINNLKELYSKTSDAKGISDMNKIDGKVDGIRNEDGTIKKNATGLTNKEVNDLSRKYGNEFGKKAFSKTSGDPLTSVNAQKFENIRQGLKETARQGLGGPEAKALDAKLSDLYDTKDLVDKQVERVNAAAQKTTKVGTIPKIGGKIMRAAGSPFRAVGNALGMEGEGGMLSPTEVESNLPKNLKTIRKSGK